MPPGAERDSPARLSSWFWDVEGALQGKPELLIPWLNAERGDDGDEIVATVAAPKRGARWALLLHASLSASLPAKLAALSEATGLPPARACIAAPGLLLLDASQIATRRARLHDCLPAAGGLRDCLPTLLRRAPRLLASKPESLRQAIDELRSELDAEVECQE